MVDRRQTEGRRTTCGRQKADNMGQTEGRQKADNMGYPLCAELVRGIELQMLLYIAQE